jgi:acyl-CoA dehydrogenase
MGSLGGQLKRKEMITGRFADIFSWMYLSTATLRRFEAEGRRKEDEPLLTWTMRYALSNIQDAFDGLVLNLRVPGLTWMLRGPVSLWSRTNRLAKLPSDRTTSKIAQLMQVPGEQRDRLTSDVFVPADPTEALGRLEEAFRLSVEAEEVLGRMRTAMREGKLRGQTPSALEDAAVSGVISIEDAELVRRAETARADYIRVDAFTLEEYDRLRFGAEGEADGAGNKFQKNPSRAEFTAS